MAVGTTAALIGAAGAIGSAGIGAAANASAAGAQRRATQQQLELQRQQFEQATELNAPYNQAGYDALDQLLFTLGLGGSKAGGGQDWNAYLQANPDAAEWVQSKAGTGQTVEQLAQQHWELDGKRRDVPTTPVVQPPERPNPQTPTNFSPIAQPGAAPGFAPGEYSASPEFRVKQDRINRDTNAGYAARGLLRSGGAIRGLNDRTTENVNLDYSNWWNRQLQAYQTQLQQYQATANQFNVDRNTTLNQFNTDRNFSNANYDTGLNNLFRLTGIGQSAANNTAAAGSAYANNTSNIYQNQANASGQYAQSNAGLFQDALGYGVGQFQNYFANKTPGGISGTSPTYASGVMQPDFSGYSWYSPSNNVFRFAA